MLSNIHPPPHWSFEEEVMKKIKGAGLELSPRGLKELFGNGAPRKHSRMKLSPGII